MTQTHDSPPPATPASSAADEASPPSVPERSDGSVPERSDGSVPERDGNAPAGTWRQLAPLLGVLVVVVVGAIVTQTFGVVGFVLAILGVVMVHEGGHFVAAKLSGMKVTEFFVGFGPRLWSIRKGETEYGVKAIPLGGYVKIIGMSNLERDIDPADEPRTYRQQSYPKRMIVAAAGIITHFLIAVIVLTFAWTVVGIPNYDGTNTIVGEISPLSNGQSPARKAGFQVGDKIVSADGIAVNDWLDLPPYIQARADKPIAFVVERRGERVTLTATPESTVADGPSVGHIGIGAQIPTETVNPAVGVVNAVKDTGDLAWRSIGALGTFFSPSSLGNYAKLATGQSTNQSKAEADASRPVSVVGVARIAGQAADTGILNVLMLFVIFNIFLGVFNLVPLLPLDGGHLAIATYERLRSRGKRRYQADVGKMMPFTAAVVVVMIMLGGVSIWLDIFRPLANPFQ